MFMGVVGVILTLEMIFVFLKQKCLIGNHRGKFHNEFCYTRPLCCAMFIMECASLTNIVKSFDYVSV